MIASPWVDFDLRGQSYHKFAPRDPVSVPTLRRWAKEYLGSGEKDYYNEPGKAPVDWWKDLPVKDLLVVAGAKEMMVDDIKALAEKVQVSLKSFVEAVFERSAEISNRRLVSQQRPISVLMIFMRKPP